MKDITIKLLDKHKKVVSSEHFEMSKDNFERRFYDVIRAYSGRAEDDFNLAVNYLITME